ncbi:unnamed protein product [Brassica rapa subsp. trilocularis]
MSLLLSQPSKLCFFEKPVYIDLNPKRISLPPLVTLPHCQIQMVTNVAIGLCCGCQVLGTSAQLFQTQLRVDRRQNPKP